MTDEQSMRLALNLHTRVIVGLIDRADEAPTAEARRKLLGYARDEALEFRAEFVKLFTKEPA